VFDDKDSQFSRRKSADKNFQDFFKGIAFLRLPNASKTIKVCALK
tara:strand:- start:57 stop:191 length:135 start_codon:yes stop_codon:yes gene_type:complete